MRWYLNDASLQGQFVGKEDKFWDALIKLRSVQTNNNVFSRNFHITPSFGTSHVIPNETVYTYINKNKNKKYRDIKNKILIFISRSTPFDNEISEEIYQKNEKVKFEETDVKDSAIGIAVKKLSKNIDTTLYSFEGGKLDFSVSPICVEYESGAGPRKFYELNNIIKIEKLKNHVKDCKPKKSWKNLIENIREELLFIEFDDDIFDPIIDEKFNHEFYHDIYHRLNIINEYKKHSPEGKEDECAVKLRKTHFPGNGKIISDETPSRKNKLVRKFKFKSINSNDKITATWHGKFTTSRSKRYSIYFDWNSKRNIHKIEILYVGPKIL